MPRKPCYWTRKLELDLVEFIREREYIWRYVGNTNHHIQQKYKAYTEFAARLGRGFTARSVRDRWVNIRSTFNHNLRRVEKSKETAKSPADVYVPCWPLWKPMQFLRDAPKKDDGFEKIPEDFTELNDTYMKDEQSFEETQLNIRQRGHRTDRPRFKSKPSVDQETKCKNVLDDLLQAMKPLVNDSPEQSYWFFGKHVTEQLGRMREVDADCACRDIMMLLEDPKNEPT